MGRYPLEPLGRVRDAEVDEAARALAEAIARRETAEECARAARAEQTRFLDEAARIDEREAVALASGVLRANDLAQRDAFLIGASLEADARARAVREADGVVAETVAREAEARARLAEQKAKADAVARDRGRFEANEKRIADAKEDESAEDAFVRPRSGRAGDVPSRAGARRS
jgi:hypothetical protein